MMNQFNPGDVVCLKSGGPQMTVLGDSKGSSDGLVCWWFDNSEVKSYVFPPHMLARA